MAEVRCFLLVGTDRVKRWLRRYTWTADGGLCPAHGGLGHDGRTPWPEVDAVWGESGGRRVMSYETEDAPPRDGPRWPTTCDGCGQPLWEGSEYQVFGERIYVRRDTGEEMTLRDAPAGAIWEAEWYEDAGWVGQDGKCYVAKLPGGGDWIIDGPSSSGGRWTRAGEAPDFTVTPSIGRQDKSGGWLYHGFLTAGVFRDA
jgi:hypothetical protein